jgi:hypothetical protein
MRTLESGDPGSEQGIRQRIDLLLKRGRAGSRSGPEDLFVGWLLATHAGIRIGRAWARILSRCRQEPHPYDPIRHGN